MNSSKFSSRIDLMFEIQILIHKAQIIGDKTILFGRVGVFLQKFRHSLSYCCCYYAASCCKNPDLAFK